MKTILVDLDGTLADIGHRVKHVQGVGRKDWKRFFELMHLDRINEWCRTLMRAMSAEGFRIAIVSGRPDTYRAAVERWLQENAVPFTELHLRKENDFRPDHIVKREILFRQFQKAEILFVVDDRQSVVDMWREEGLVCLQCQSES